MYLFVNVVYVLQIGGADWNRLEIRAVSLYPAYAYGYETINISNYVSQARVFVLIDFITFALTLCLLIFTLNFTAYDGQWHAII